MSMIRFSLRLTDPPRSSTKADVKKGRNRMRNNPNQEPARTGESPLTFGWGVYKVSGLGSDTGTGFFFEHDGKAFFPNVDLPALLPTGEIL